MNHETQRLLAAASRGARVQTHYHDDWGSTGVIYSHAEDCNIPQRIHPEDTALQYGPVATELRKMAEADVPEWSTWLWYWVRKYAGQVGFLAIDEARWLCAFAAELAADEGL